jgi:23S rRNA (uracil1939-C5)-methyltransferase
VQLTPGQKLNLKIEDIAFGGEGVARWEDFVVFVPFVANGEEVEAEITEVKKRFARAKLLRILTPSPERVEPACRYFGACGGCQYQHLAYATQLRIKHKQIVDLFQRIGGFDGSRIAPVIPCPQPYAYRNRLMIRSQWNRPEQKLNIGFVRWDGGLVEDIEECQIAEPALNEQIRNARAHPPPKGGLKLVLRIPPEGWVFLESNWPTSSNRLSASSTTAWRFRRRGAMPRRMDETTVSFSPRPPRRRWRVC